MRIVGGTLGGRRLVGVPRRGVRPTSDPVREALFNILAGGVAGLPFVDLFAGTGAVAFEAYSRGARPAVLVEEDGRMIAVIERNLERFGIDRGREGAVVIRAEVGSWMRRGTPGLPPLEAPPVIFLDPPYADRRLGRWLAWLPRGSLALPGALVVAEHASAVALDPEQAGLEPLWTRRYGDTSLTAARVPG